MSLWSRLRLALCPPVVSCERCRRRYLAAESDADRWRRVFCTMECAVLAQEEQVM